jgi:hypothetical protein
MCIIPNDQRLHPLDLHLDDSTITTKGTWFDKKHKARKKRKNKVTSQFGEALHGRETVVVEHKQNGLPAFS